MTDILPRPTLKTAADAIAEIEIAAVICRWANVSYLKIGYDHSHQQKSRIDGALARNETIVAFAEIKTCSTYFGDRSHWTTGYRKIHSMTRLYEVVRVPVVFFVRFGCGSIGYLNPRERRYQVIADWGRFDRDSPGDQEPGARFRSADIKIIGSTIMRVQHA